MSVGVAPQQAFVGARKSVFGQNADHFKQRGADFIVQIFGGQFLLARAAVIRRARRGKIRISNTERLPRGHDESSILFLGYRSCCRVRHSCTSDSVLDAAKLRIHVRIVRLEPVAKRSPQHAGGRARRSALHHEMFAVKEIRGISGIKRKCLESRETARKVCASIPIRCPPDRQRRNRCCPRDTIRPAPDPIAENQNCRAWRRAPRSPGICALGPRCACRRRRDAIPLRWAILFPPSGHRRRLRRGSRKRANRAARGISSNMVAIATSSSAREPKMQDARAACEVIHSQPASLHSARSL